MKKSFAIFITAIMIIVVSGCSNSPAAPPDSQILVSSLQIGSEKGDFEITSAGGQLQLFAQISPDNADDKSIQWSVTDGAEHATVSDEGLVTAVSNGTVCVCVSAQDGSGVKATKDVIISGQSAEVTFNLSSDDPVSDSASLYYQLSTDMSFSGSALCFESSMNSEGEITETLPADTYYVRAFHDLDGSGALSAGDTLSYLCTLEGGGADTSPIDILFIPEIITLVNGQTETINLSITSQNVLSNEYGILHMSVEYDGSAAVVSETHQMSIGFSSDPTLYDQDQQSGISVVENNCSVYLFAAAGEYYAGGFLDADASNTSENTMPSEGDPIALYDHIEYNGVNQGTAIEISSGGITEKTFILDDTFLYGGSAAPKESTAIWNVPANETWMNLNSFPIVAVDDNQSYSGYEQKLIHASDENGNNLVEINLDFQPGLSRSVPVSDFPSGLTTTGDSVEIVFSRWAIDTGFALEELQLNDVSGISSWTAEGAPEAGEMDNYFAWYASGSASVSGTFDSGTHQVEMDLSLEQGWNLIRKRQTLSGGDVTGELCTTVSVDNLPDSVGWINFLAPMLFFRSTADLEGEYGSGAFESFRPGTGGSIGDSGEYTQDDIDSMLSAGDRSGLQPYIVQATEFRYGYHDLSGSYVIIAHYGDDSYGVFPIDEATYTAMDGADPYNVFG